jgi:hypothetical protein
MYISVVEVLINARDAGIRLSLEDGKLIAEASEVPPALVAQLQAARSDLLPLLALREAAQPALAAERPSGARAAEWADALRGLKKFLADGWGDQAMLLGWAPAQLFAVPPVWARIDLTGVALLVGRWRVVDVDAAAITIKPPWSDSQLKFQRSDDLRCQLAAVTKVEPAAEALPEVATDLVADEVSAADGAAIARFKAAAKALFGQGVEVVRVGPDVEHLAEDPGHRPAAVASVKMQAPRMRKRSTFREVRLPVTNVAEIMIHNAS